MPRQYTQDFSKRINISKVMKKRDRERELGQGNDRHGYFNRPGDLLAGECDESIADAIVRYFFRTRRTRDRKRRCHRLPRCRVAVVLSKTVRAGSVMSK